MLMAPSSVFDPPAHISMRQQIRLADAFTVDTPLWNFYFNDLDIAHTICWACLSKDKDETN